MKFHSQVLFSPKTTKIWYTLSSVLELSEGNHMLMSPFQEKQAVKI